MYVSSLWPANQQKSRHEIMPNRSIHNNHADVYNLNACYKGVDLDSAHKTLNVWTTATHPLVVLQLILSKLPSIEMHTRLPTGRHIWPPNH
jgi:hypothetical protein